MTETLILEKLDKLERHNEQMDKKLDKLDTAVSLIAVQTERINNVSTQVNSLWAKYDAAFSQGGVISEIKTFQGQCPREYIKVTLDRQWVVIGLIGTTVVAIALKAFGVV
jgi:hypothetical protein